MPPMWGKGKPTPRRPARPFIEPSSPEFLRILPAARAALDDAALDSTGKPRNKGGRPKGVKNKEKP